MISIIKYLWSRAAESTDRLRLSGKSLFFIRGILKTFLNSSSYRFPFYLVTQKREKETPQVITVSEKEDCSFVFLECWNLHILCLWKTVHLFLIIWKYSNVDGKFSTCLFFSALFLKLHFTHPSFGVNKKYSTLLLNYSIFSHNIWQEIEVYQLLPTVKGIVILFYSPL